MPNDRLESSSNSRPSDYALSVIGQEAWDSFRQSFSAPLVAVAQGSDAIFGTRLSADQPARAEHLAFGTPRFWARQIGTAAGMLPWVVAASKATGLLIEGTAGSASALNLAREGMAAMSSAHAVATGAAFGAFMTPSQWRPDDGLLGLVRMRSESALTLATTFGVMGGTAMALRGLGGGTMARVVQGSVSGLTGGYVDAHMSAWQNHRRCATEDELFESGVTFLALGTGMAAIHRFAPSTDTSYSRDFGRTRSGYTVNGDPVSTIADLIRGRQTQPARLGQALGAGDVVDSQGGQVVRASGVGTPIERAGHPAGDSQSVIRPADTRTVDMGSIGEQIAQAERQLVRTDANPLQQILLQRRGAVIDANPTTRAAQQAVMDSLADTRARQADVSQAQQDVHNLRRQLRDPLGPEREALRQVDRRLSRNSTSEELRLARDSAQRAFDTAESQLETRRQEISGRLQQAQDRLARAQSEAGDAAGRLEVASQQFRIEGDAAWMQALEESSSPGSGSPRRSDASHPPADRGASALPATTLQEGGAAVEGRAGGTRAPNVGAPVDAAPGLPGERVAPNVGAPLDVAAGLPGERVAPNVGAPLDVAPLIEPPADLVRTTTQPPADSPSRVPSRANRPRQTGRQGQGSGRSESPGQAAQRDQHTRAQQRGQEVSTAEHARRAARDHAKETIGAAFQAVEDFQTRTRQQAELTDVRRQIQNIERRQVPTFEDDVQRQQFEESTRTMLAELRGREQQIQRDMASPWLPPDNGLSRAVRSLHEATRAAQEHISAEPDPSRRAALARRYMIDFNVQFRDCPDLYKGARGQPRLVAWGDAPAAQRAPESRLTAIQEHLARRIAELDALEAPAREARVRLQAEREARADSALNSRWVQDAITRIGERIGHPDPTKAGRGRIIFLRDGHAMDVVPGRRASLSAQEIQDPAILRRVLNGEAPDGYAVLFPELDLQATRGHRPAARGHAPEIWRVFRNLYGENLPRGSFHALTEAQLVDRLGIYSPAERVNAAPSPVVERTALQSVATAPIEQLPTTTTAAGEAGPAAEPLRVRSGLADVTNAQ